MSDAVPYEGLTPDVIASAVESYGFETTGSILGLASYENRVYQIRVADGFVVAKFYRPGRWKTDAILEEHEFALELAAQDIPVVPPIVHDGKSLHEQDGYRFAVYERRGGRWPELGTSEDREWLGRFLGRIHAVGATRRFKKRPTLDREEMGARAAEHVLEGDWLPSHLVASYENVTEQLVDAIEECFEEVGDYRELRIHGDCHRNNVLWTDDGPHFVDLDDCMNGPAVQDSGCPEGSRDEMSAQLGDLLEGCGSSRTSITASLLMALRGGHAFRAARRAAGTIPRSRARFRGSMKRATGSSTCKRCSSSAPYSTSRRSPSSFSSSAWLRSPRLPVPPLPARLRTCTSSCARARSRARRCRQSGSRP